MPKTIRYPRLSLLDLAVSADPFAMLEIALLILAPW